MELASALPAFFLLLFMRVSFYMHVPPISSLIIRNALTSKFIQFQFGEIFFFFYLFAGRQFCETVFYSKCEGRSEKAEPRAEESPVLGNQASVGSWLTSRIFKRTC